MRFSLELMFFFERLILSICWLLMSVPPEDAAAAYSRPGPSLYLGELVLISGKYGLLAMFEREAD